MGTCRYCGRSAGWFSDVHAECEQQHQREREAEWARAAADQKLKAQRVEVAGQSVRRVFREGGDLFELDALLTEMLAEGAISHPQKAEMLVSAWEETVDAFLDDGLLSEAEQDRLFTARDRFALSPAQIDRKGAFTRVVKAAVLRQVVAGQPPHIELEPGFPANLRAGESPVWCFPGVRYLEDRERREYQGRSQGVSLRVMSGVYYRIGGFKGEPVFTTERKLVGTGMLLVTTENLYFLGSAKSVRIPFSKIVSFEAFSDGFGLMRDLASAKPQFFVTGDGWFAYNLVVNLAKGS